MADLKILDSPSIANGILGLLSYCDTIYLTHKDGLNSLYTVYDQVLT